ncbi:hypothetical protein K8O93_00845 [Gordonia bronchialis]|nr:hypothetical protein [Gordonia bronchialis]UAK38380.1 hypothetical protein K8O93_00845 [Gordonia bronchialis]
MTVRRKRTRKDKTSGARPMREDRETAHFVPALRSRRLGFSTDEEDGESD